MSDAWLSVYPASATLVERMFSIGRDALPFIMAASHRQTISKRFLLRMNCDAAIAFIRAHPELRPMLRIATGDTSLQ